MDWFQALFVDQWPWWAGGAAIGGHMLAFLYFKKRLLSNSAVFQGALEALEGRGDPADPAWVLKARTGDLPVGAHDPAPRWRVWFMAGLVLGGAFSGALAGTLLGGGELPGMAAAWNLSPAGQLATLFIGGLFIGFGTRFCGGCTSGHAIVGISGLQWPSLVATAIFFATGMLAAFLMQIWRGLP